MFPERNISIGARADRRSARQRMIKRKDLRRAEGWIARRGDFLLPAFVCFLWSFLCTSKESGVPEIKESTINNPANPQICRRRAMQRKRIATAPCGASGWRSQGMHIGAEKDLIRRLRRHLPQRGRQGSANVSIIPAKPDTFTIHCQLSTKKAPERALFYMRVTALCSCPSARRCG